jgi:hypothetical protein
MVYNRMKDTLRKQSHGHRMDYQNRVIQPGTLGARRDYATRPGFETASLRKTQSPLGNYNIDNPVFWIAGLPAVPPTDIEFGLQR